MKRAMLLASVVALTACDSMVEPEARASRPSYELIENGTAYTNVDAQLRRLYDFNNCLAGLPPYNAYANCQAADMTYDVATLSNWMVSSVFDWGITTSKAQALGLVDYYMFLIDQAYAHGRISCRGRYAVYNLATTLRGIISSIVAPNPADVSAMPQPLNTPIWDLNPFAGANYNGTPCGAAVPAPPFSSLVGYTVFAINSTCGDNPRSIELNGAEFYLTQSVHSNASMRVAGSDGVIWENATYRCTLSNTGANNWIGAGPTLASPVVANPLASYNGLLGLLSCNYLHLGNLNLNNNGTWWVGGTSASRRLRDGVWCATGGITLTLDDVSGNVMLKAGGVININADITTLKPIHSSGIVLYTSSGASPAISINGTYNSFVGYVYAPSGQIDILGSDFTQNGALVGRKVRLIGPRTSVVTRD